MSSVPRFGLVSLIAILGLCVNLSRADLASVLPKAFQKAVPEDIHDLQEIEQHVKKMMDKILPCTVGLQIGQSSGSGVIVSMDGYVLTAGHVSGQPDQDVRIILHDGKIVKGKTLGANKGIDSGMIKITDKGKWPFVEMAKGDLQKGDWCLAVGHPNGYIKGRTPVVRLGRVLEVNKGFVRTDCTLVGGDSGGPLFDMLGNVIGIHSRIGPTITANIHVPVSTYRETWDKLAQAEVWGENFFASKGGKKKDQGGDAYLGIRPDPIASGLKVQFVGPGSPAANVLKVDDVIISMDGKKMGSPDDYDRFLATRRPGNVVALEVRRGEDLLSLKVTLGKRSDKS